MFTSLDVDTRIYRLLNVPSVKAAISGDIYKGRRPDDSTLEDVIINTPTLGDGTRQFGVSNVNIYVPDIVTIIGGKQQKLTNSARLITLTNLIKPLLEETDGDDFVLWIEKTQVFEESAINQHFMNIRLEIRMYNH